MKIHSLSLLPGWNREYSWKQRGLSPADPGAVSVRKTTAVGLLVFVFLSWTVDAHSTPSVILEWGSTRKQWSFFEDSSLYTTHNVQNRSECSCLTHLKLSSTKKILSSCTYSSTTKIVALFHRSSRANTFLETELLLLLVKSSESQVKSYLKSGSCQ